MPIYLYWGEDDFTLNRAVMALRDRTLDPDWASFNYDKIPPEQPNAITQALNQAMTPPFGAGSRLVWLVETTLCQRCPEETLAELERTLPALSENVVLLLTTSTKPDGRLKSTKLLQKLGEIREFAAISPWKTDQLMQRVRQAAQEVGVKLTSGAIQLLAEAIGNDTRQLFTELEKLRLYAGSSKQPVTEETVALLVTTSTQSSLQLAAAIRQGETAKALSLVADLLNRNEPALRIVMTLVGQFRTRLWVKLMVEAGERDERAIAQAAEVNNPKQIYFLQKEISTIPLSRFQQALPLLLELEAGLKRGAEETAILQTKTVELCQLFQKFC
ncbi:MAG: DNA polymerase III subunit delta [Leptolyngbyaceae cyanobacterium SM1_4_3]|nr:DNA polymerase III subunit delta [Leptolyngbyaceae cyanobacterium SM1_4_3]